MAPHVVDPDARSWFQQRTVYPKAVDLDRLVELKRAQGVSITICLPARNEEATVGSICRAIRDELLEIGLIDQMVVMDSRSTDSTADVARQEGAEVYPVTDVFPDLPGIDGGKGEAVWKSLAVARGDIILWSDSDTRNFTTAFVSRLLEPLLEDPDLILAKAFYERPIAEGDRMMQFGGARVTELVARPLLNLFYPELSGVIQPLSGEYAVRTDSARSVSLLSGYAPDIGLLISIAEEYGIDRIVQVDLGTRIHRNQDILALGRMAHQVMQGMLSTFDRIGRVKLVDDQPTTLTQFLPAQEIPTIDSFDLAVVELPRMASLLQDE